MSAIISVSIKKADLDALRQDQLIQGKKDVYIPLSIFINDDLDKYDNNVSVQLQQSKEDQAARKPRTFLGNGKVVYIKDGIKTAKQIKEDPF